MARNFSQAVRRQFESVLPERLPPFQWIPQTEHRGRGTLFAAHIADDLYLFAYVSMNRSHDAFTLEVAWNRTPEFPFGTMPRNITRDDGHRSNDVLAADVYRARISALVGQRHSVWWSLGERPILIQMIGDLRRLTSGSPTDRSPASKIDTNGVAGLVDDACDTLQRHAMPLFREVVEAHGRVAEWESLRPETRQ